MKTKSLKRREIVMKHSYGVIGIAFCLLSSGVSAQQVGINLTEESIKPGYTGKSYSPYAQRDFPSRPFFGDQHVHTLYSMDAALFGNTLDWTDPGVLRVRKKWLLRTGIPVKLSPPSGLDGHSGSFRSDGICRGHHQRLP